MTEMKPGIAAVHSLDAHAKLEQPESKASDRTATGGGQACDRSSVSSGLFCILSLLDVNLTWRQWTRCGVTPTLSFPHFRHKQSEFIGGRQIAPVNRIHKQDIGCWSATVHSLYAP
jgi:hypothetical protein